MKDKTITQVHFNYTNEQVKVLGFKNLADFETKIPYTKLKQEQKYICEQINLSIEWFKKLFPQEGFDLRKINYSFENIDQVLGFMKKLFGYLCIQYDYYRIKGIPTLRLIQPNNLYSIFIMNLRNIPQKEDFILKNEIDNKQSDITTLVYEDIESKQSKQSNIDVSKSKKFYTSEWKNSSVIPDLCTVPIVYDDPSKSKKFYTSEWKNSSVIPDLCTVPIVYDDPSNPVIKLTKLFDKFEKKNVTLTVVSTKKLNFDLIPIDWINTINISLVNDCSNCPNNFANSIESKLESELESEYNYKCESLPENTTVSLVIGTNEIILHTISTDDQNIKINFPNNFLYKLTSVFLQINLPENSHVNSDGNLMNNIDFKYELDGWNITNKNILSNFKNEIIEFDNNKIYSCFDLGIIESELKTQIKNYYRSKCANNGYYQIFENSSFVSMKYLMEYLKKPYEKKYIMNNTLCLNKLNIFGYFNWIKIKTLNGDRLNIDTRIELKIGGIVVLTDVITTTSIFDDEKYYKFQIDFPNNILYLYHTIDLKIILPNNNCNDDSNTFEIIINGTNFKVSTPKMFFNTSTFVCFDHDSKWFVPGKIEFITINGMVGNRLNIRSNREFMDENEMTELFKKIQKKNLLDIKMIKLDSGITSTCIFVDIDLQNDPLTNSKKVNPLTFLVSPIFKEYLFANNMIKHTGSEISFGSNVLIGDIGYHFCEQINTFKYKIYFEINTLGDLFKHIDIKFKNLKTNKSKKTNDDIYNFDVWIENDGKKIYTFGTISFDQKIRLSCENKYINLINLPIMHTTYLVAEIPCDKFHYWKKIEISLGYINSDTTFQRHLSQYAFSIVNVIE
jgi:hypothetical protein